MSASPRTGKRGNEPTHLLFKAAGSTRRPFLLMEGRTCNSALRVNRARFTLRIMRLKFLSLLIPFLSAISSVSGVDLRERMTAEEFAAAGLSRLSAKELTVLESWMAQEMGEERRKGAREAADLPEGEEAFGLETVASKVAAIFKSKGPKRVVSTIEGKFNGWDGDTVFRLANGQVWKQTDSDRFYISVEDPKVEIKRAAFGSYLLSPKGYGSSVRVRRVD